MKKLTLITLILLMFSFTAFVQAADSTDRGRFCIAASAGTRSISEDIFKTVYGSSNLVYGLDLSYSVSGVADIFLHTDYLKTEGETTFTAENATFSLIPLEVGVRFRAGKKNLIPYFGVGAGYYKIKDEMEIAGSPVSVEDNKIGFFFEGGLRFYFSRHIFILASGKYVILKFAPDASYSEDSGFIYYEDRKLGGLLFSAGLGIRF